ncbi:serine/threonine-protein kinase [Rhodocaloribacter litoris]|uniref:serine/threonine-protein kinase n=1 Tax=Rhodocaloribacter litoris TaxID=2558931 RepID=UPI00141E1CFE|nr:serine/threonine-protein kinase [Rhodocaloribacter litoris]QXD16977.1 serine/threonine-protein kinase [Rhodocaloribacter litoris]
MGAGRKDGLFGHLRRWLRRERAPEPRGQGEGAGTGGSDTAERYFQDLASRIGVHALARRAETACEGGQVGAYRLVRLLGRGGMGAVYLAERADGHFEKRVALKLLPREKTLPEVHRRFLVERHLLARLEHPGIARLYDGGVTRDGRPYYAMEYVEGRPIDVYCDAQRLDVRARLRLFLEVCAAVQHAHRNLIVHQDLKPAHILVRNDGQVRLLDFGIAKLWSPGGQDAGEASGASFMTPAYAAPEQRQGAVVTPAGDVYALGVVLHELLVGCRPRGPVAPEAPARDGRAVLLEQWEATCRSGEGYDPEAAARVRGRTRAGLRRLLAGDLGAIVARALHPDPARRYDTAGLLAADLERYLRRRPVTARPDTPAYRAACFVRRHPTGIASTALVLALMVSLVVLALRFAFTSREQARRLAHERDRAEEVSAFLQDLFRAADPTRPGQDTLSVSTLLRRGTQRIASTLHDQPATRAVLMSTLGGIYMDRGQLREARRLLDTALALQRNTGDVAPLDLAGTLNTRGVLAWRLGHYAEARTLLEEALALRRRHLHAQHLDVARTLNNLAIVLHDQGQLAGAEAHYRAALRIWQRVDPGGAGMARVLQNLGAVLRDQDRTDEARAYLEAALALHRAHPDASPLDEATTLHHLGFLALETGNRDRAEALHRQALALREARLGARHPAVAVSLMNVAAAVMKKGAYDEAAGLYRRALAIQRDVLPAPHLQQARALVGLGLALLEAGQPAEAEPFLREGLAQRERLLGPDHWRVADTRVSLGACLAALGRFAEADTLLTTGYERLLALRGPDDPLTRTARARRATLLALRKTGY